MGDDTEPAETRPLGKSAGVTVAVVLAVGIAMAGLVYSFIAIPVYFAARIDPDGLDKPYLRNGFLQLALPLGLVVGLICGTVVGLWYRRGGHLPEHRPFEE